MGWIGVDLDGTLAKYGEWKGDDHIGEPVPKMLNLVKMFVRMNKDIRIFTARANNPKGIKPIQDWCEKHIGKVLPITAKKDYQMLYCVDDRAKEVYPNSGIFVETTLTEIVDMILGISSMDDVVALKKYVNSLMEEIRNANL